jgi:hypothetical protein
VNRSTLVFLAAAMVMGLPLIAHAQGAKTGAYKSSFDGWQVKIPAKWKYAVQGGALMVGSDTEAGLMTVEYTAGMTLEQMEATAAQGLQEEGMVLQLSKKTQRMKIGPNQAVVAYFVGQTLDGVSIRGKGVGLAGKAGGVVVLGVTTPEKMPNLEKRVDETARSVRFFTPKASQGASRLMGPMCTFSGGSVGSTTQRMSFDGKGRVGYGSETVMGGSFHNSQGDWTGSWGGSGGNQNQTTSVGRYEVKGKTITIRWQGSVETCRVHNTGRGGRITEMYCGEKLWAPSLCG